MKPFNHNLDDELVDKFADWFKSYQDWILDPNPYTIECLIAPFKDSDFFSQQLLNGLNSQPYVRLGAVYRILSEYPHILAIPEVQDEISTFKKKLHGRDILRIDDLLLANAPSIYNGMLGVPHCRVDNSIQYFETKYDETYHPELLKSLKSHFKTGDDFGIDLFYATAQAYDALVSSFSFGNTDYDTFNRKMLNFKFKKERILDLDLTDILLRTAFNTSYNPNYTHISQYGAWLKTKPTYPQLLEYFLYISLKLPDFKNSVAPQVLSDISKLYPAEYKQLEIIHNIGNYNFPDSIYESLTTNDIESIQVSNLPTFD